MPLAARLIAASVNLADKKAGKDVGWINIADARALTDLGHAERSREGWDSAGAEALAASRRGGADPPPRDPRQGY